MPLIPNLGGSQHPLSGLNIPYVISDDDSSTDPQYFGYLNSMGGWYILKIVVASGTYRYASGKDNYSTNWAGRAGLSYSYFNLL